MNKTGRPTKLTDDTLQRIIQAIELGATYEHAANYGGITYKTFNEWRKRGDEEIDRRRNARVQEGTSQWETEEPFVVFCEAIKSAEGNAVTKWLAKIEKAATDGNWQAAAWKLERRYPGDYGRQKLDVEHSGNLNLTWQQFLQQADDDST